MKQIIPAVKRRTIKEGTLVFDGFSFSKNQPNACFAQTYLQYFLRPSEKTETVVAVELTEQKDLTAGAYRLTIGEKIQIEYADREGVRNAIATVLQLLERGDGAYRLPYQTVEDEPDCKFRSVLIDLARGLPELDRLKEDILRLSLAKCNYIHLHLMDSMGLCYVSDAIKNTTDIRGTKLYTKEQMKDLVAFCDSLGIEIMPEIEIPAHASFLVNNYPDLACKTTLEDPSIAVICAGSEATYEFFDALIQEIVELFPGKYLHIGGDELYFDDFPSWNYKPNWLSCSVCRATMEKEGLKSVQELYYYVVRRMHALVQKYGKTMVMWNDQLDNSKPLPIPKDIVVHFWRISHKDRGPREGCSYHKFEEQGFRVIASPREYCYVDMEGAANPEKTSTFNVFEYDGEAKRKELILGAEACAWEYGNPQCTFYKLSFTPSCVLLLAKMWNGANVCYDKPYRVALTKLIWGCEVPENYDTFPPFGSVMPPRQSDKWTYASKECGLWEQETISYHAAMVEDIPYTYSNEYKQAYLETLKNV